MAERFGPKANWAEAVHSYLLCLWRTWTLPNAPITLTAASQPDKLNRSLSVPVKTYKRRKDRDAQESSVPYLLLLQADQHNVRVIHLPAEDDLTSIHGHVEIRDEKLRAEVRELT